MRNGDFSGLVNTPSGWLPQAVVDQYKTIAPNAVTANDSTIYQQYNLVNGNQFSPITLPAGTTSYTPFPGNVIPKSMLDASALNSLPLIVPASSYYLNSNGLISNIFTPRCSRRMRSASPSASITTSMRATGSTPAGPVRRS
jgi:hypothetical protein